jgi:hypothetical protein
MSATRVEDDVLSMESIGVGALLIELAMIMIDIQGEFNRDISPRKFIAVAVEVLAMEGRVHAWEMSDRVLAERGVKTREDSLQFVAFFWERLVIGLFLILEVATLRCGQDLQLERETATSILVWHVQALQRLDFKLKPEARRFLGLHPIEIARFRKNFTFQSKQHKYAEIFQSVERILCENGVPQPHLTFSKLALAAAM